MTARDSRTDDRSTDDRSTDGDAAGSGAAGEPTTARRLRLPLALLSVLALLLAVAAVVLGLQVRSAHATTQAREDAVAAAEQQAVNVTSLSAQDIDAALARVADGGTGDFKAEYDQQAAKLKEAVTSQQVVATSSVVDSAVVRAGDDDALVLVVIDGSVTNKAQPTAQPRRYRMQLELARVGDRWLTSSLSILS